MTYEAGQAWSNYQEEQRLQQARDAEAKELLALGNASISRAVALQERIGVDERSPADIQFIDVRKSMPFAVGLLDRSNNIQGYAVVEVARHSKPVIQSVPQRRLFGLIRYSAVEHGWEPTSNVLSIALKFYAHKQGEDTMECYDGSGWSIGSCSKGDADQLARMQPQLDFLEGLTISTGPEA